MAQEIADSKLIDTWSSDGLKVKPDISKIIEGWQLGEQPPHEYMNWLQNTFGSKLNHILKNGVVKWEPEKEYLAGATTQHNGNVWLCKTTNTNSEPADVNANWKRIITVESLTTVLSGYVKNSGDETIAGVKTFSLSPIVPTPATTGNVITMDNIIQKTAVGLGYGTGAGGIVTQLTSKSTAVTLNKPTGTIITNNSALAAGANVVFAVNNSVVSSVDTIIINCNTSNYIVTAFSHQGNGTFTVSITNMVGSSLSDPIYIDFSVIKGANS